MNTKEQCKDCQEAISVLEACLEALKKRRNTNDDLDRLILKINEKLLSLLSSTSEGSRNAQ